MIRYKFTDLDGLHRLRLTYNLKPVESSIERNVLYLYSPDQITIRFTVINRVGELVDYLIPDENLERFSGQKALILNVLNDSSRRATLQQDSQQVLAQLVQYGLSTDKDNYQVVEFGKEDGARPQEFIVPPDFIMEIKEGVLGKDAECDFVAPLRSKTAINQIFNIASILSSSSNQIDKESLMPLLNQLIDEKSTMIGTQRGDILGYVHKPHVNRSIASIRLNTPTDSDCYLVGYSKLLHTPDQLVVTRHLPSVEFIISQVKDRSWYWYHTLEPLRIVKYIFDKAKEVDNINILNIRGCPIKSFWNVIFQALLECQIPYVLFEMIMEYFLDDTVRKLKQDNNEEKMQVEKTCYDSPFAFLPEDPKANMMYGKIMRTDSKNNSVKFKEFKACIEGTIAGVKHDSAILVSFLSQIKSKIDKTSKVDRKQEYQKTFKNWLEKLFSEKPILLFHKDIIKFAGQLGINITPYMGKAADALKAQQAQQAQEMDLSS